MLRLIAAAALIAGPVSADTLDFTSLLTGDQEVLADGSPAGVVTDASGTASISVDDVAQTIDFVLDVDGISLADLFDDLVAAPVGPIHLHNAPAGANGPIVIPFAFDEDTYSDTASGFSVNVTGLGFSEATALAGVPDVPFDGFLAALVAEEYYINVHTDAFSSGELRGQVSPVPLPAGGLLALMAIGALGGLRLRRRA